MRKNFKSNLVLVVVLFLESKGLYSLVYSRERKFKDAHAQDLKLITVKACYLYHVNLIVRL